MNELILLNYHGLISVKPNTMNKLFLLLFSFFLSFSLLSQSVGIGTTTPDASAMLEVKSMSKGLLIPRLTGTGSVSNPANGLIIYNTSTNEIMYNSGTSGSPQWETIVVNNYWTRSGASTIHNTNLIDFVGIGLTIPMYQLHIQTGGSLSSLNPVLALENAHGTGFTSMVFLNSGFKEYSMGVDILETDAGGVQGTFKILNIPSLASSSQGDGNTMLRSFPSGITDINNQSRCRVYQQNNTYITNDPLLEYGQAVSYNYWTPVYYTTASYDQHGEYALGTPATPAAYTGGPNPPAFYFFTATEEGYYQVNARVDFAYVEYNVINENEAEVTPIYSVPVQGGYVSIGIFKADANGQNNIMYSQGNKLMASSDTNDNGDPVEQNNLAPNVSDVIYLQRGEKISIWVYQTIYTGSIPLRVRNRDSNPWVFPPDHDHPTQVYVSIHKVS